MINRIYPKVIFRLKPPTDILIPHKYQIFKVRRTTNNNELFFDTKSSQLYAPIISNYKTNMSLKLIGTITRFENEIRSHSKIVTLLQV